MAQVIARRREELAAAADASNNAAGEDEAHEPAPSGTSGAMQRKGDCAANGAAHPAAAEGDAKEAGRAYERRSDLLSLFMDPQAAAIDGGDGGLADSDDGLTDIVSG